MRMQGFGWIAAMLGAVLTGGLANAQTPVGEEPAPGVASEPTDQASVSEGKRIFERAAGVIRGAKAVSYRAGIATTAEMLKNAYPVSRVDVKLLRSPAGSINPWLSRVSGQMERKEKDKELVTVEIDLAWLSSSVELVDHDKKEVVERAGKTTQGPGMTVAQQVRPVELFGGEPYASERGSNSRETIEYTMEGKRTIDGAECDVVLVTKNGRSKQRWAISTSDGFPRLIEKVFEGMLAGTVTIDISNVLIETADAPALQPAELRVVVPEGYKETRVGVAPHPQPTPVPIAQPEDRLTKYEAPAPATEETGEESPVVASAESAAPEVAPAGPILPRPAPLFELKTPAGETLKLADMKGKVVVVQFFGSWCLQCPQWHMQLSEAIKPLTSRGVEMLALSVRERDDSNAVSELAKGDFGVRHLLKAESAGKDFGVMTYPATFVIDREGVIQKEWQGKIGTDVATEVADAVNAALGSA